MNIQILEHKSASYGPRTYANAAKGDVTIAIAVDYTTAGERLTHKAAGDKYLKLDINLPAIDCARLLWKRLNSLGKELPTINIAGNGIYTLAKHGISQEYVNQYVYDVLRQVGMFIPIGEIVSGGQTGVDLAGGVAGSALGVPTTMLLPNGYLQRHEDKIDRKHTMQQILCQVVAGVDNLK